jgi:magnesium transporter
MFLVDAQGVLVGTVPLAKLVLGAPTDPLQSLIQEPLVFAHPDTPENEVAEIFDKYNLLTLPVVDEQRKLEGVITSDDVISLLRAKL